MTIMAYTLSRPGELSGEARALFYKKWLGEVLMAYEQMTVFKGLITNKTIDSGKSGSFPIIQDAPAPRIFIPGVDELTGSKIENQEVVINIDGLLVGDTMVYELDEWMSEYAVRDKYNKKLVYSMALATDSAIAAEIIKDSLNGSNRVNLATQAATVSAASAEELVDAIFGAAETLDNNKVMDTNRYLVVCPSVYYKLFKYLSAIDKDYGGQGSIATGQIMELAGFKIIKSNTLKSIVNIPDGGSVTFGVDMSADGGNKHQVAVAESAVGSAGVLGLAFTEDAAAMLTLRDLIPEINYIPEKLSYLIAVKMAAGFGALRPEAAVMIADPAATISAVV